MSRTTDQTQLDRATDPEYAAISSTAVIGLVVAVLGVWPLLLITKRWVQPPSYLTDLVVMTAIFTAAALVAIGGDEAMNGLRAALRNAEFRHAVAPALALAGDQKAVRPRCRVRFFISPPPRRHPGACRCDAWRTAR